jgi:hypothetical protein
VLASFVHLCPSHCGIPFGLGQAAVRQLFSYPGRTYPPGFVFFWSLISLWEAIELCPGMPFLFPLSSAMCMHDEYPSPTISRSVAEITRARLAVGPLCMFWLLFASTTSRPLCADSSPTTHWPSTCTSDCNLHGTEPIITTLSSTYFPTWTVLLAHLMARGLWLLSLVTLAPSWLHVVSSPADRAWPGALGHNKATFPSCLCAAGHATVLAVTSHTYPLTCLM